MSKKITQKQLKHDEFVDAAFDFGHWLEEHWAVVARWAVGVLIVLIAVMAWFAWSRNAASDARELVARGIDRYEEAELSGFADQGSLNAALETFEKAPKRGETGALARFYLGATLYRLGRLDEAKAELEQVVGSVGAADTLGATAQLLLVRTELAAGRSEEATRLLEALAGQADAAVPPAETRLELARLHASAGRDAEARAEWQRILDDHPDSAAAAEARAELE